MEKFPREEMGSEEEEEQDIMSERLQDRNLDTDERTVSKMGLMN